MQQTKPNYINHDEFFTPAEVAHRWRWHPESVRRWTRLGKLAVVKVSRRTLIPRAEVEALEADGRINSGQR